MSTRARRLGFGAALATGLSLLGLSVGGIASLDADLRAAAEQRPGNERVILIDRDGRDCPLDKHRDRGATSREL